VHRAHRLLSESTRILCTLRSRPREGGWKVFEAPGVEPVFPEKNQAINYAHNSDSFRSGEIRILDSRSISNAPLRSTRRIENCDAVIRVYDEAGNVTETHVHPGRFQRAIAALDFRFLNAERFGTILAMIPLLSDFSPANGRIRPKIWVFLWKCPKNWVEFSLGGLFRTLCVGS
jgi:hypothetical protein